MFVGRVEAGTIDGPLGARICIGGRIAGRDDARNRIGERFGRETPDLALEDSTSWRGVDFVDPPIVGCAEFEETGRIVAGIALSLADQDPPRVGPAGGVDVVKHGPEVDVVGHRRLSRGPTECRVAQHVRRLIAGVRIMSRISGADILHDKVHLGLGEGLLENANVVNGTVIGLEKSAGVIGRDRSEIAVVL